MGRVKKGQPCSVKGCNEPAVRSLSPSYSSFLVRAGLDVTESSRLYLCESHYKKLKKLRSEEEKLERWRLTG
ncbi:MAG: hypothetical protein DSO08_05250 [Candidatus Methanomethylicota archaeon]|uniref:Uncharacterized protein n=1 Tax=Thermoproteota archaeon TaxID=2056631 RepID=A0A523B9Q9_9CREN|nr:MAG: hypothetical protein DSO08_05250 [Candidatus Verstraetearchaeota archaeon]